MGRKAADLNVPPHRFHAVSSEMTCVAYGGVELGERYPGQLAGGLAERLCGMQMPHFAVKLNDKPLSNT